jgi:RNA polymerase sigma-70 factor (ECF subfamily)
MRHSNRTDIGGVGDRFLTTEWSLIESIQCGEDPGDTLVGRLLERYWKPVYCYLRRKGLDNEAAKDLTQGFFQEVVLGRDLIRRADHAKGSFRKLLLTAVEHYVRSEHRKQSARKRSLPGRQIPFDQIERLDRHGLMTHLTAEESFNYAWLTSVLDEVLVEVETQCRAHGLETHWHVFQDRVLAPILNDAPAPCLAAVSRKYDIASPITTSNMIVTVNRRLRATLRRHLRQYVSTDALVEEELAEFLRMFCEKRAG